MRNRELPNPTVSPEASRDRLSDHVSEFPLRLEGLDDDLVGDRVPDSAHATRSSELRDADVAAAAEPLEDQAESVAVRKDRREVGRGSYCCRCGFRGGCCGEDFVFVATTSHFFRERERGREIGFLKLVACEVSP